MFLNEEVRRAFRRAENIMLGCTFVAVSGSMIATQMATGRIGVTAAAGLAVVSICNLFMEAAAVAVRTIELTGDRRSTARTPPKKRHRVSRVTRSQEAVNPTVQFTPAQGKSLVDDLLSEKLSEVLREYKLASNEIDKRRAASVYGMLSALRVDVESDARTGTLGLN